MKEQDFDRLYKAVKKQNGWTDAYIAQELFGFKNARSLHTSSARLRYKQVVVKLVELLDHQCPWVVCGHCGHYNTDQELEAQLSSEAEKLNCVNCGETLRNFS